VPDNNVIQFNNVSFAYETTPVLTDATFMVNRNDSVSVVGPNGGGKTTLLKLILGLIKPGSGEIQVLGDRPERTRKHIGYMPQYQHFDTAFPASVMDVVLMGRIGGRKIGFYSKNDRAVAMEVLEEMNIAALHSQPFSELSGGQVQRVLIARALACKPQMLLLDEPTANVDPAMESQFVDILKNLSAKITILTVSHDLGFVSQVVNRVLCVNQCVKIHPTSEITGEVIKDIYGGDFRMVRHDHQCSEEGHVHG
jgi:zinc transport system ATP-binding protein